jgi:hypothetical protein
MDHPGDAVPRMKSGNTVVLLTVLAALPAAGFAAPETSSAIPDLSGVWGRNTIDYSAPDSGKGPLKNISGSRTVMVGDFHDPMLKPWAADIVKRNGEIARTGAAFPTAHNQCWPEPPPYILGNQELQVLQQKHQVLLMYSHGSQVRHVRLNATHPANPVPSWYGDSIGHYEGGALVVDTIGVKLAPLSSLDRYGTPHTPALHVVERYHMVNQAAATSEPRATGGFRGNDDAIDRSYKGKVLRVDFTVEDPGTFNMSWSGVVVYNRAKGMFIEDVCAENIHDYITGKDSAVPTATSLNITGN